jgi:hypothetical protein
MWSYVLVGVVCLGVGALGAYLAVMLAFARAFRR